MKAARDDRLARIEATGAANDGRLPRGVRFTPKADKRP